MSRRVGISGAECALLALSRRRDPVQDVGSATKTGMWREVAAWYSAYGG